MEWTDESIARLRALWAEGLSTAEIGRRMQITKNAVVGKAHRLDLAARPSPIRKTEAPEGGSIVAPKRPAQEKPRAATTSPVRDAAPVAAVPPAVPVPVVATPVAAAPAPMPASVVPPVEQSPVEPPQAPEPVHVEIPAEAPPALPDNVHLLRPIVPKLPEAAVEPATPRPEPVRVTRSTPAEPRRRGLTCCWPLGEPGTKGFHFCGADPTPGKPYCAEHAALAYVKLRDRRDSVA